MARIVDQIITALAPYGMKQEGHGKYRCASNPFRPTSDSHSFTVTVDGDQLVWYDHRDSRGGGTIELARALGIDIPRNEAHNTKRRYGGMADYAQAHGLTEDDLRAAMWREATIKGRPAIEFQTETGRRWRFIDGEKPYYTSEPGYRRCWYGLRTSAVKAAIGAQKPVVIANGEISVIAAAKYDIPAICITGGETGNIPDDLLDALKTAIPASNPIIIALDCDDKGRKSARQLKEQLSTHWKTVRAIDLHLTNGG